MKRLLFIGLTAFLIISCQQSKYFKVSGTIKNAADKTLSLERMDLNKNVVVDSIKLDKKGKYSFKEDRLTEPTFFRLQLSADNFVTLLVDTCAKIEVNGDGKNLEQSYIVENSLECNQIKVLNRKLRSTKSVLDSLSDEYKQLTEEDADQKLSLQNDYLATIDDYKKFIGSFVMDNPRSFASYYALFQKVDDQTYMMNVMNKNDQVYFATIATSLNLMYPESKRVKQLYKYVLSAKVTQRRMDETKKLMSKAKAGIPEINEKTPDGKYVKLSSLKGKLVLLSFWASWDQASRKENKNLVKIYKRFKNKGFEIYQVSLDRSKILWELAIEEDNCSWINVSDIKYTDSYPALSYNVQELPTNYLISPKGDIIGKDLFGNRLEDKLEELLK